MTAFINLKCKIPGSPIKKQAMLNVESIKYFTANNGDGTKTLIYFGGSDYLVADDNFEEVQKKIKEAYYGIN